MKKNIVLIIICLFLLSLFIHYLPVYKKGYSFNPMGGLTIARNLALTGEYKIDSKINIILSSDRIKDEGITSNSGNKLNPYIYSQIFKIFGFNQNLPLYVTLIIWALAGIILFLIVLKLFNLQLAIIFGLIDILIPVLTQGSLMAGFYEWPVLFFSLGLLFYFWPKFSKKEINNKNKLISLIIASLFFALATLAKNSFIVSFVPFVVYEFWQNKSFKKIIIFILPFILLFGGYLLSGYITGLPNAYLSSEDTDFGRYGHLFPDPYTYHFEKDEYLNNIIGSSNTDHSWFLLKYGYHVSLQNKLILYWHAIKFYPIEFLKLVVYGGSLIILFLIIGLIYLYKERKSLFKLFVMWGIFWYILLIFFKSRNWDHFLEIRFLIVLLISLGISWLINFILDSSLNKKSKYLIIGIFSLFLLIHFGEANKWMLHDEYSGSKIEIIRNLSGKINKANLNKQYDVIAVNTHPTFQALNYYTDQSIIYFDSQTINKLLSKNKLNEAFEYFNVTKIIGFDIELSKKIENQTGVKTIE